MWLRKWSLLVDGLWDNRDIQLPPVHLSSNHLFTHIKPMPSMMQSNDELIDQFSQLWLAHGLIENTLASYGSDMRQLARFMRKLAKMALREADAADLQAYLAGLFTVKWLKKALQVTAKSVVLNAFTNGRYQTHLHHRRPDCGVGAGQAHGASAEEFVRGASRGPYSPRPMPVIWACAIARCWS